MIINLICFNKFLVSFLNSTTNRPHHAVRSFTVLNNYRYQEYFHEFNIGICFNIYATEFIEPQFMRPAGGGVYVCGFREGSLYAIDYYPDQYCHHRGKYISKVNLHENCNIQPDRVLEHMLRDCLYILWSRATTEAEDRSSRAVSEVVSSSFLWAMQFTDCRHAPLGWLYWIMDP